MRLRVDDEIYRVDGVWLGPPRRTLPWRARYIAYAVGLIVFLLLQVIQRRVGIGLSFFSLAYSLLGTVVITQAVLRTVDHDRGLGSLLFAIGHEISAPRPGGRPSTGSWRPGKVRVSAGRKRRRVRHHRVAERRRRPAVRHVSTLPGLLDQHLEPALRPANVEPA